MDNARHVTEALDFIRSRTGFKPAVAIILGSGLSGLGSAVEGDSISYADIPGFPMATVAGHPGVLKLGKLAGVDTAFMLGRLHYYEGYSTAEVAFPVRLAKAMGATILLSTCTVGALKPGFEPGELATVTDHINLLGGNPLRGANGEPRFVDMVDAYSPELRAVMKVAAEDVGFALKEGIYVAVSGPCYETPAEARFLSGFADFVGMSLVPEIIVARQLGVKVVALAVITNVHDGGGTSHDEVIEVAERIEPELERLTQRFIKLLVDKGYIKEGDS